MAEITWLHLCVFPLDHPRNSRDFDSFSDFLEKLEISFGATLRYYVHTLGKFFPVLSKRGSHIFFHQKTPKRPKNSNKTAQKGP